MVIFHSYVSLPEGITFSKQKSLSDQEEGEPDWCQNKLGDAKTNKPDGPMGRYSKRSKSRGSKRSKRPSNGVTIRTYCSYFGKKSPKLICASLSLVAL